MLGDVVLLECPVPTPGSQLSEGHTDGATSRIVQPVQKPHDERDYIVVVLKKFNAVWHFGALLYPLTI